MSKPFLPLGVPAPWFYGETRTNPRYTFDTVAGRYVVLSFLGRDTPHNQQLMQGLLAQRALFDDLRACFFGVLLKRDAEHLPLYQDQIPGIRFFFDTTLEMSQRYRTLLEQRFFPCTYILDERLRVIRVIPQRQDGQQHAQEILKILSNIPRLPDGLALPQAPVLIVPRIFEPSLCQTLMDYYQQGQAHPSGFMREVNGQTVLLQDHAFKRRTDCSLEDAGLLEEVQTRLYERLRPEIAKAFQFEATRIERHIVACYDSSSGGFFRPHRDNTTKGTAHRRFAVSLNLNTGDYDGGMLRFPEFGQQLYQPPRGGALVFSCSLLHEATPVTRGQRYAYLPFLYTDADAQLREQNRQFLQLDAQDHG